ncbi:conserved hypothetical protein [Methylocella tundrae]|uniref:Uncharacterized protein n=1 Tax=Methylocella tundrae TaxID=227605 RepID=A0A8B6M5L1_METTU|nr:hypothetical protein [Methylocella tundrae]VTZ49669.1 conserved hypothetical protein [Methylocella tundrae]
MKEPRDAYNFMEVEAAYCFDDHFAFIAYDSDKLWIFDAGALTYRKIQAPFSLASIHTMTGDEKKPTLSSTTGTQVSIIPMCRRSNSRHSDLAAETAVKSSFAPVEAVLLAAGFEPGGITLQPNARGRIIASDARKAALLEFCQ